jgi:hypothetical protein
LKRTGQEVTYCIYMQSYSWFQLIFMLHCRVLIAIISIYSVIVPVRHNRVQTHTGILVLTYSWNRMHDQPRERNIRRYLLSYITISDHACTKLTLLGARLACVANNLPNGFTLRRPPIFRRCVAERLHQPISVIFQGGYVFIVPGI